MNYDIIRNYLIVYLTELAIPLFKNRKMKEYIQGMTNYSMDQIMNSQR